MMKKSWNFFLIRIRYFTKQFQIKIKQIHNTIVINIYNVGPVNSMWLRGGPEKGVILN